MLYKKSKKIFTFIKNNFISTLKQASLKHVRLLQKTEISNKIVL